MLHQLQQIGVRVNSPELKTPLKNPLTSFFADDPQNYRSVPKNIDHTNERTSRNHRFDFLFQTL